MAPKCACGNEQGVGAGWNLQPAQYPRPVWGGCCPTTLPRGGETKKESVNNGRRVHTLEKKTRKRLDLQL